MDKEKSETIFEGNSNFNNTFTKVRSLNKNKTIYSKNKLFMRKLVSGSFCLEIQENFEKFKGSKLSNIFDLKNNKIRRFSIAILITYCLAIFLLFIDFILIKKRPAKEKPKTIKDYLITLCSLILIIVVEFILALILLYYFQKSDIEKYSDFLDCKNVNKNFFKQFSNINKLRNTFYAFFVINIVIQGLERLGLVIKLFIDLKDDKNKQSDEDKEAKAMKELNQISTMNINK